jgi:hypothetical protein
MESTFYHYHYNMAHSLFEYGGKPRKNQAFRVSRAPHLMRGFEEIHLRHPEDSH